MAMRKKGNQQPLISSRYAAMYIPNTEWVFMDAMGKSDQSRAAFENGEISTKGKNIQKYLELTAAERLRQYRESQRSTVPQPPKHILELLKLQAERGKFESLEDVMNCLFMPKGVKFRHDGMFTEWEKATAYAIAAIRQQNEFFDALCGAHDKAFALMESNEIIFEARELLNRHQFTSIEEPEDGAHNQSQELSAEEQQQSEHTSLSSQSIGLPVYNADGGVEGNAGSSAGGAAKFSLQLSTAQLAQAFQGLHTIDEANDDMSVATAEHSDTMSDTEEMPEFPSPARPTSGGTATPSFGALQDKLVQLSANRDEVKIAAQQGVVNKLQLEVITLCIEIEKKVEEVHVVAQRCIELYNASDTRNTRFKQFDELTCMLGDGMPPTVGFTDWRVRGVVGIRPTIMQFLLTVQRMAEERLTLQELEQPGARRLDAKISVVANLGRWKLLWNGHDVVHKVVHCLDFLRKCRELSEWYGPSFYFVGNPLMLPFPLHPALESGAIDVTQQVYDQQMSVPHLRLGNANVARKKEWEHQQYLNRWRRQFQAAAECWAFNFPTVLDIKEDPAHERLYDCLLVLCVTCQATLKKSYLWEKKFIAQIQSVRGQDRLLIGTNTGKVDKKLDIPPAVARKPRPVDILNAGDPRGSNAQDPANRRKSSAHANRKASDASFAPYGYSLVSNSQSKSGGLMDSSLEEDGENNSQSELPAIRPNLAKAMNFTKMVKSAEETAALKAQQQLAQMRKASVLNRNTLSPSGRRGTNLGGKSRSPSIAGPGGSPSRRTSSRPSVSAGALDSPSALNNNNASPGRVSSAMRKSSSASMLRQDSGRRTSAAQGLAPASPAPASAMHNPLRKASSVSAIAGGAASSNSNRPTLLGGTGKFSPPSRAASLATMNKHVIHEEASFDSDSFGGGDETPKPAPAAQKEAGKATKGRDSVLAGVTKPGAAADKRGSVLRKSSTAPQLGKIAEIGASGGSARKPSAALAPVLESGAKSASVKMPGATTLVPGVSSKSLKVTMAPVLSEDSVSSADSKPKRRKSSAKHSSRKKSTAAAVTAEASIDNTTVSIALASPSHSPAKGRRKSSAASKRPSTAESASSGDERLGSPAKTPTKKKRGSTLLAENKASGAVSNIVTRLPPVQANMRLTRRKGSADQS